MSEEQLKKQQYWQKNIQYMLILLSIWFLVSFGAGIIFVEPLNEYKFMGIKLGFWFSQQGSIYIFVILIFIYTFLMNRLDRQFGFEEDDEINLEEQQHAKEGDEEWKV